MTTTNIFNGAGDVVKWAATLTAKLIAKGYRSHILDANRPVGADAAGIAAIVVWDTNRDKALGMVMSAIDPDIMGLYVALVTPETLIAAVVNQYRPQANQEIDRLEREFKGLTYDEKENPIAWVAKLRNLINKLTTANAAPSDRAIKTAVWDALEEVYGVRVEIMRHSTPNMTVGELWAAVTSLPHPIKRVDSAFAALNLTSYNREMEGNNRRQWNAPTNPRGRGSRGGRGGGGRGHHARGTGYGGRGQSQSQHYSQQRPPPPPQQQEQQPQEGEYTKKEIKEYQKMHGLCYNCNSADHPFYECPQDRKHEVSVSEPPPQSSSSKGKGKDNSEDKGKDLKSPHAYAFFSQVVEENAQHQPPPKRTQREPIMGNMAPIPMPTVVTPQYVEQRVSNTVYRQAPAPGPAPVQKETYRTSLDWYKQSRSAKTASMMNWWEQIDMGEGNIVAKLEKERASTWSEIDVVHPTPLGDITKVSIGSYEEPLDAYNHDADADFGCISLTPGAIYSAVLLAKLVIKQIDTDLGTKMVELEESMKALTDEPIVRNLRLRSLWIVWCEIALFRGILRQIVTSDPAQPAYIAQADTWLGMAGIHKSGLKTKVIPVGSGVTVLQNHNTAKWNFEHSYTLLVRLEVALLVCIFKHYGWLSSPHIRDLVGITGADMMEGEEATMESVVIRLCHLIKMKGPGRITLHQVHLLMSNMAPLPKELFQGMLGMENCVSDDCTDTPSQHSSNVDECSIPQLEDSDDEYDTSENNLLSTNLYDCNKNGLMSNECAFVHSTEGKSDVHEIHWYSKEVADALKRHDLSLVWVSDSGATKHMTCQKDWVSEMRPSNAAVRMGNGDIIPASGIGNVSMLVWDADGNISDVTLCDVLYIPRLKANLFSITRTVVYGSGTIIYHGRMMHLKPDGITSNTIAIGNYTSGMELFILDCTISLPEITTDKCFAAQEIGSNGYVQLMHKRLAHASAGK
jgi:hypothetical protein